MSRAVAFLVARAHLPNRQRFLRLGRTLLCVSSCGSTVGESESCGAFVPRVVCIARWACPPRRLRVATFVVLAWSVLTGYLVDPASSHMLVSKIKPCMSKYKRLYCETANGSLNQLWFI